MPIPAHRIAPWELGSGEAQHDVSRYERHLLAEGDSWFSFGSFFGNSLLDAMAFDRSTLITQTAMPGDTLSRMADWWRDANFNNLLSGRTAWHFDAILISGGGNDLINALTPQQPGAGLLKSFNPAQPPLSAVDCISDDAWDVFTTYLRANFEEIAARVRRSRLNSDSPVFVHTYDLPTPRHCGAGFGKGPWLCTAFEAHNIPDTLWMAVTDELFGRFHDFIATLQIPNVHVVDTVGMLDRPALGELGETRHWINEIHPNSDGYRVLAGRWRTRVEDVLS